MASKKMAVPHKTTTRRSALKPLPPPARTLVLRTCRPDMGCYATDAGDFRWPRQGPVECADWSPEPKCGGGLHGLAWGQGDWSNLSQAADAVWMVVEVATADLVHINDDGSCKVKFPRGRVVFSGSRVDAMIRVMCSAESMSEAQRAAMAWGREHDSESSGTSSTAASSGDA